MKNESKNKDKLLKKSNNNKQSSPTISKKKHVIYSKESNNYNFFNFDENGDIEKEENHIDADKLIKKLEDEQEDTKILLNKLHGRRQKNRDFMKEMEQEKLIRERYNTKKNLMQKKKNEEYNRIVKIIKDPISIKRTNRIEKELNNNLKNTKTTK